MEQTEQSGAHITTYIHRRTERTGHKLFIERMEEMKELVEYDRTESNGKKWKWVAICHKP